MSKKSNKIKTTTTTVAVARKPRKRNAAKKSNIIPGYQNPGKRWHLGVQDASFGPFSMKGLSMGSGDKRSVRGDSTLTNTAANLRRGQYVEMDEVIRIIAGTLDFDTSQQRVQIADPTMFPWAAQIAKLYERYKFKFCEFYYKPIVSGFAPAGQSGKVILSFDYDSVTPLLTDYRTAETMDPHSDGLPCEIISMKLEPERLTPSVGKFVRVGVVPVGTDPKTYDAGVLNVHSGYECTWGCWRVACQIWGVLREP